MKTSEKLAKLLQESIPEYRGHPIVWSADRLYAAQGAHRTGRLDCYRWGGFGNLKREDGSLLPILHVNSYYTMTELVRGSRKLCIGSSDEIYPEGD